MGRSWILASLVLFSFQSVLFKKFKGEPWMGRCGRGGRGRQKTHFSQEAFKQVSFLISPEYIHIYSIYSFAHLSWHSTCENELWMADLGFLLSFILSFQSFFSKPREILPTLGCLSIYLSTYLSIYLSIDIGIVWLRAPSESRPFRSSWTRTLLGGRVNRAQLLWNVHNFLQTWTASMNSMTSSQTLQKAHNQTTPIYKYIIIYISLSTSTIQYLYLYIHMHIIYNCNDIYNHLPKIVDKSSY